MLHGYYFLFAQKGNDYFLSVTTIITKSILESCILKDNEYECINIGKAVILR